jgi:phage I-like protein
MTAMSKNTSTSRATVAIALAACSFRLPAAGGDTIELQVTPAGEFRPADGREMKVDAWRIDQAIATRVIERFRARKTRTVVDYEHQTLHKEANGQPAPAAAWIHDLVWRDGQGLYAVAKLTATARQKIDDEEYLYFSPVFTYAVPGGDVLDLRMGAFTNTPGIDGMEPLTLVAAATFGLTTLSEIPVNELLKKLLEALGLPADTTEEKALEAISALKVAPKEAAPDTAALCAALDLKVGATSAQLLAACTSLKARAATAQPDMAKFVPVEMLESVKSELAVLTTQVNGDRVDALIKDGLASGKLLPAQEAWARDLGKTAITALSAYLDATAPIAALTATQTGGKQPDGAAKLANLSSEELAVCTAMGLDPADFAKSKAA